jgi:hypothetical protein
MILGCREGMEAVLPFREPEVEFLTRVNEHGEIVPELLTNDPALADRIRQHPQLLWKVSNVKEHRRRRR